MGSTDARHHPAAEKKAGVDGTDAHLLRAGKHCLDFTPRFVSKGPLKQLKKGARGESKPTSPHAHQQHPNNGKEYLKKKPPCVTRLKRPNKRRCSVLLVACHDSVTREGLEASVTS